MALRSCRYCRETLTAGVENGRPADFCTDEHRRLYQEQIQRETLERLRSSECVSAGGQPILHAGLPPGLMQAPPLRGKAGDGSGKGSDGLGMVSDGPGKVSDGLGGRGEAAGRGLDGPTVREAKQVRPVLYLGDEPEAEPEEVLETATAPRLSASTEESYAALSEAMAQHPPVTNGIGQIEKTDNASLSNLLREARDRIANDPSPNSTALAIRRKARPGAKRGEGARGGAKGGANGDLVTQVRSMVDLAIEPPALDEPMRPEAQQPKFTASSPVAQPDYPTQVAQPTKPNSSFAIEIEPPTLAMPAPTLMERIPWYAKLAVVLALAAGGGVHYWSTLEAPAPVRVRPVAMDEVKPLSMAGTEWTTVKAVAGEATGRTITLHKASMELTDYRVEFVGTVDYKALGWACRIEDPGNYYAAKLVRNASSKAPLTLVRWRVVNGEAGPETVLPLEMGLPSNEQYTVTVEAKGKQITTSLQGKVIDRYTDSTFTKGGFGYLNQNTERGKVLVTTIGMLRKNVQP